MDKLKVTDLLNEIERLDKEASPKPWKADPVYNEAHDAIIRCDIVSTKKCATEAFSKENNAEFIALARTALPLLAQYVKRYREALEAFMKIEPIEGDEGAHYTDCTVGSSNSDGTDGKCDCGVQDIYDQARKSLGWSPDAD